MPKIVTELPGPKAREYVEQSNKYEPRSIGYQEPMVWEKATGCVITDVDGNEFLDWSSGVLVTNVGHCHPYYVEQVKAQAEKLFNCYDFISTPRVELAKKLVEISPDHLDKAFIVTTGSDATEAAIRMAGWEIIGFHGAFHGRTLGAASVGASLGVHEGYGPLLPGCIHAPFPYCYRCPFGYEDPESCGFQCLEYLDWAVSQESGELCAVISEPYQGGAGSIIPPAGWFEQLDQWRQERGLIFILDEVQSSFGRTGKMFAMEHWDIKPDLVTLGKGLASGVPCSAVIGASEVMDALPPGSMGSTFGGNPLSAVAALASIEIIEREHLVDNSARLGQLMLEAFTQMQDELGQLMLEAFTQMQDEYEQLGDVRGMGLVLGLEIVESKESKKPAQKLAAEIVRQCYLHGLACIHPIGMFGNVIRVAPPLVITEEQVGESLDIFETSLKAALAEL